MKPLLLVGGGGHCRACIDVIQANGNYIVAGVVLPTNGSAAEVMGYPVVGIDAELDRLVAQYPMVLVAIGQIGSSAPRLRIYRQLKSLGANLPIVQSPNSYLARSAIVGEGSILMHYSLVNAGATIGVNCIVNSHALVEHDVAVGDHCHVSTGAILNGCVSIGPGSFIGSGAIVREGVKVGTNVIVSAGVRVFRNQPDGAVVRSDD